VNGFLNGMKPIAEEFAAFVHGIPGNGNMCLDRLRRLFLQAHPECGDRRRA
jgi:hypothetical protein